VQKVIDTFAPKTAQANTPTAPKKPTQKQEDLDLPELEKRVLDFLNFLAEHYGEPQEVVLKRC
jgi:hypothetical protein